MVCAQESNEPNDSSAGRIPAETHPRTMVMTAATRAARFFSTHLSSGTCLKDLRLQGRSVRESMRMLTQRRAISRESEGLLAVTSHRAWLGSSVIPAWYRTRSLYGSDVRAAASDTT